MAKNVWNMGSNLQNLGCKNLQNLESLFETWLTPFQTWLTPSKKSFISMAFEPHSWRSIHDYFFGWNLCKNTFTWNLYNFLIHPFQNMHLIFLPFVAIETLTTFASKCLFLIAFSFDSLKTCCNYCLDSCETCCNWCVDSSKTCWDFFDSYFNPLKTSLDFSKTYFNLLRPIGPSISVWLEFLNYWKMQSSKTSSLIIYMHFIHTYMFPTEITFTFYYKVSFYYGNGPPSCNSKWSLPYMSHWVSFPLLHLDHPWFHLNHIWLPHS